MDLLRRLHARLPRYVIWQGAVKVGNSVEEVRLRYDERASEAYLRCSLTNDRRTRDPEVETICATALRMAAQ